MSRYALNGNTKLDDVIVGYDDGTQSFFLQCFAHGRGEEPVVWVPVIRTLDELERTVRAQGLELPDLLNRMLLADQNGVPPRLLAGDYVHVIDGGQRSDESRQVLDVEGHGEQQRVRVELMDGASTWLSITQVEPDEWRALDGLTLPLAERAALDEAQDHA